MSTPTTTKAMKEVSILTYDNSRKAYYLYARGKSLADCVRLLKEHGGLKMKLLTAHELKTYGATMWGNNITRPAFEGRGVWKRGEISADMVEIWTDKA